MSDQRTPETGSFAQKVTPVWQGSLLVLMVLVAYLPAICAGFVWDDDRYVTNNPLLTAPDSLKQIWFSFHRQSQYFPLVYTSLKLERMVWGLHPLGYHLVNVLLHGANAALVWLALRRLALPGAWFGAALFALHPVQVESVAWITEIKNAQSTLFFLLAFLGWIKFSRAGKEQAWRFYLLTLIAYLAALLSKTTACTFPAAMVLALWLQRQPLNARRWCQIAPFVVLGIAMGLVSVFWERHLGSYREEYQTASLGWIERFLVAARALWFYAGKLAWPANLSFSYPRWEVSSREWTQYLWVCACIGFGAVVWIRRKQLGRGPISAILFFVATLSPLIGFIPNYTFRYSYVADHYQYLASVGLLSLFAAALFRPALPPVFDSRMRTWFSSLVLVVLAALTWNQAAHYRDDETLWLDTARKNPRSWMAYGYLGFYAELKNALPQAATNYRKSVDIYPSYESLNNLGRVLMKQGITGEAVPVFRRAFELHPTGQTCYNLACALAQQGNVPEAMTLLKKSIELSPERPEPHLRLAELLQGLERTKEAIAEYVEVLRLDPNLAEALAKLAAIRASDANAELRNGAEAVRLAERACELTRQADAFTVSVLGMAYAEAGRFEEAVAAARKAATLAAQAGDQEGAQANRKLTELFESKHTYHDAPSTNGEPGQAIPEIPLH